MVLSRFYRFLLRRKFLAGPAVRNERILVVTRSINDTLYSRSQSLLTLPYPRRRITGMNHWIHAREYLHLLFEYDVDWIINVDEDCFVFDNGRIEGLLRHMEEKDYDFCGIPDGGACVHRFHNPVVPNPFFSIFHVRKIRPALHRAEILRIQGIKFTAELERFTPRHLLKEDLAFAYDDFECFYSFFFWLLLNGFNPLFLPSVELEDGMTTELRDHENVPFLYHGWFTRGYGRDDVHTQRIDRAFEMAVARKRD
jgi:hypothetical protein